MAASTSGTRTTSVVPKAAMAPNHSSITQPNTRPTPPAPIRCTLKSPTRITTASGTVNGLKKGVATSKPSTAPSTVMAGVINPSPYSSDAPKTPKIVNSQTARGRVRPLSLRKRQRHQRQNAPFAAIVRAQHERDVLQRYDQDEGPEDKRKHAQARCRATLARRLGR